MYLKTSLYLPLLLLTAVGGIGCEKDTTTILNSTSGEITKPDRIAYESNDKIYVIDADGSNNRQVTSSDRSYYS